MSSISDHETTPNVLINENGLSWLGFTANDEIFKGKSAFKLMQAHGKNVFNYVPLQKGTELTLRQKKVMNSADARAQIEEWVGSGTVELGSCALCFDEMPKKKLFATCGRRGCSHRANGECLMEWVGHS